MPLRHYHAISHYALLFSRHALRFSLRQIIITYADTLFSRHERYYCHYFAAYYYYYFDAADYAYALVTTLAPLRCHALKMPPRCYAYMAPLIIDGISH